MRRVTTSVLKPRVSCVVRIYSIYIASRIGRTETETKVRSQMRILLSTHNAAQQQCNVQHFDKRSSELYCVQLYYSDDIKEHTFFKPVKRGFVLFKTIRLHISLNNFPLQLSLFHLIVFIINILI